MIVSTAELHLRRARELGDPQSAIAEYMKAIAEAVRQLQAASTMPRPRRR